ncbi:MAG: DUF1292 domain-containing protein [bacterium]|nr:DUF1292 domain-containing protein [bacterium]
MANNNSFKVIDKEGKEVKYDVLFTFESDETNKNYIVYTDNALDEKGNIKVYASTFEPNSDVNELKPIETNREWEIIEAILQDSRTKAEEKSEGE